MDVAGFSTVLEATLDANDAIRRGAEERLQALKAADVNQVSPLVAESGIMCLSSTAPRFHPVSVSSPHDHWD